MFKLFLLFTLVPLAELSLLLVLDDALGFWPTVALVVVTGVVGAWLAKMEGARVLRQWRRSMVRGVMPEEGVIGGMLVLVGGVLLVTPGVLTDLTGLLLLLPPTRRRVADWIRVRLQRKFEDGSVQVIHLNEVGSPYGFYHNGGTSNPRRVVMDVEPEDLDPFFDDDDEDDEDDDRDKGPHRVLH